MYRETMSSSRIPRLPAWRQAAEVAAGCARCRLAPVDIVAQVIFLVTAFGLFRLSVFQGWSFIGDSDRLNTVVNVRLFEVLSILQRGSVPAWSEQQFMGYGIVGLHWMLPGSPPLPQFLALLPTSEMYHALAVLAALMLAGAMAAAYWLLGMYTTSAVQRVVGAMLYGTGSYLIHKLTQLDLSFAAMIAPPILVGLVRLTRRETIVWTFLGMMVCWSLMVVFTVLQEITYIALLWGSYSLYRSVRLRDAWPLVMAGLAFTCGVIIGAPRVLTIAADIPFVTRTSSNLQTSAVEALRYFGDGLLGRSQGEQGTLRGPALNMHEGVQLLSSGLAALAVFALGLLSPNRSLRPWSVALLVVLSVGLNAYFRPFYELQQLGLRGAAYPSRELRTVLINAVLLGLPVWLLSWWLARRARKSTRAAESPSPFALPGSDDLPFFFSFVVLSLAAILIPEARAVLYYGFMKMDFLHSRISVAMTLPLAILAAVFLNRFLPARLTRMTAAWFAGGVVLGMALWLGREVVAGLAIDRYSPVLDPLRPQRLLTLEVVRVLSSLLVLVLACIFLVCRARASWLLVVGGVLASWMTTETLVTTDHRLNGPQVTAQTRPFSNLDYMQAAPGEMRIPTPGERAALRERLQADQYRVVLVQQREQFLALPEPHLSAFWDLRLVEGYSTGLPRRLNGLPWQESMVASHHLDIHSSHSFYGLPWKLLAALNVKYAVIVDRSLWLNPGPGAANPPLDLATLEIVESPYPVTPRAFFAARVSPAGQEPRFPGDNGRRPAPLDPQVDDPVEHSVAEGWPVERQFSTAGALTATFDGDRVLVQFEPASEDRFLVLNEMYHPLWQAEIDGTPTTIYPTNLVMRGILAPAGASTVELRYVPFIATPAAIRILAFGLLVTGLVVAFGVVLTPRDAQRRRLAREPSTEAALGS